MENSTKIEDLLHKTGIMPKYTEIGLFLMSLTFLLLLTLSSAVRTDFFDFLRELEIALIAIFLGFCLSIYHTFSSRRITNIEKLFMLSFAIFINAFVGLKAGFYVIE